MGAEARRAMCAPLPPRGARVGRDMKGRWEQAQGKYKCKVEPNVLHMLEMPKPWSQAAQVQITCGIFSKLLNFSESHLNVLI